MGNYYHVRISNNKKNPKNDFEKFKKELALNNEAPWDKDRNNKIKPGDVVGFITGEKDHIVELFKVKSETDRENHWVKDSPYVRGNGTNSVKHRNGIMLTSFLPKTIEWKILKESIKFAPGNTSWMPRGMCVVKNKHLLPFQF